MEGAKEKTQKGILKLEMKSANKMRQKKFKRMRKTVTIIKDKIYLIDTKSKKSSRRENKTEQVFLNNQ